MVLGTGVAIVAVVNGGKEAVAGAGVGIVSGAAAATKGAADAVAIATGVGISGGAITGAAASGSIWGAVGGAIAGGTSATGVGSTGLGIGALLAGTGGIGPLVLGTRHDDETDGVTFDCWKPVIHETSLEPSNGMLLNDVMKHPNIARVTFSDSENYGLPYITMENVWKECFEIQYVMLPNCRYLACHAKKLQITF